MATIAVIILAFASGLYVRKQNYEIFLIHSEWEKNNNVTVSAITTHSAESHPTNGVTFVKEAKGVTQLPTSQRNLLTLLDGPYPNNSTRDLLRCDRLLVVGGGIGVTPLIPWAVGHPNVKLARSIN
ncbi:hypothetical protein BCR34DRAFT_634052 [Clohesyomyces aquaticus]|uniref:FAD-binding FR-type domain-containing protein n=1 Tax=Clohesyomyces aquaticus TaxID=1231657 RepID=A0A1Y1Z2N5_9PLEO|nr:hypothetical protein BCR34DRAFT_634052 [Clohesyomyces aquaticus]